MKFIPFLKAISLSLFCIKKQDLGIPNRSSQRLYSISNDSLGTIILGYKSDSVSGLYVDTGIHQYNLDIQFLTENGNQAVIVSSQSGVYSGGYLIYLLNPYKLPTAIYYCDSIFSSNFLRNVISEDDFFYSNGGLMLDSVIEYFGTKTFNNGAFILNAMYTGNNLTQINEGILQNGVMSNISSVEFSYSDTPNIFRGTDSLIYIYSYPNTAFNVQYEELYTFLAETFSGSTWNQMQESFLQSNYSASSQISCLQNESGQVISEVFSDAGLELFGKTYSYRTPN